MLRVINIEDSADDSLLLQRFLRRGGKEVHVQQVCTRREFLRLVHAEPWDVILADYSVPGFDAPEALDLLKNIGADIPFIVVSGAIGEDAAAAIMRKGAADFVTKAQLTRLLPAIERELVECKRRREREREQKARLDREAQFRAILDNSPAGIYLKDLEGRYTIVNRTCGEVFGLSENDMVGRLDGDLFPDDLARSLREEDSAISRLKTVAHREAISPVGDDRTFLATKFPVFDNNNNLQGVGGIYTDISELKRAEEVLRRSEKLAAAGRLAATIAHEINNPLEAIVNLVYLSMADNCLPENVRNYLQLAERELARVSHIAKQTLGFYRESSAPTQIHVTDLAMQVLELYERKALAKSVTIVRDLDPSVKMHGVAGEIVQVFSNLIANAIDACQQGGHISLRLGRSRTESAVRVLVADDGVGIPRESLNRIYEPFFTTKKDVGTGLGLWVTRQIVDKHQGKISFRTRTHGKTGTIVRVVMHGTDKARAMPAAEIAS